MLFEYMKIFYKSVLQLENCPNMNFQLQKKKNQQRDYMFLFFFPYDMPNVGITGSNRLAQLLQMNVKVPSTEPVRKHVFNKWEFHFSYSFESWPAITSSTRPLFLVLKLPPLTSPPLLSPLLSSPLLPSHLLLSMLLWALEFRACSQAILGMKTETERPQK